MWNSPDFYHGITLGAEWYIIHGGMQDWCYNWRNEIDITIEVSETKWPSYSPDGSVLGGQPERDDLLHAAGAHGGEGHGDRRRQRPAAQRLGQCDARSGSRSSPTLTWATTTGCSCPGPTRCASPPTATSRSRSRTSWSRGGPDHGRRGDVPRRGGDGGSDPDGGAADRALQPGAESERGQRRGELCAAAGAARAGRGGGDRRDRSQAPHALPGPRLRTCSPSTCPGTGGRPGRPAGSGLYWIRASDGHAESVRRVVRVR